jgi:hypothetical protein
MSLNNAKHSIAEINGVRCTIIETGISTERMTFLKKLLEANSLVVMIKEDPAEPPAEALKYTIGVTDLVFNPVFVVYERRLKTIDGQIVSPDIWNQKTDRYIREYWAR